MTDQSPHTPAPPAATPTETPEQIVADAIDRHLVELGAELKEEPLPSESQIERMVALSHLRDSLTPPEKTAAAGGRRFFGVCFVSCLITALLLAGYLRVQSSAVELNIEASSLEVDFDGGGKDLLIPGEDEEALSLTHATISGIEDSDLPPNADAGDSLQLRQDASKNAAPIRLQRFAPPATGPFSLILDTSYQPKERGLILSIASNQESTASMSGPVPREDASGSSGPASYDAMTLSGKKLRMEIYPVSSPDGITVLRNVTIKAIHFQTEEAEHGTSVLGGSIFERDLGDHPQQIQSGDSLQIEGAPLHLRQLIFKDGVYQLSLSSPKSSKIQLGEDNPKNLMPTFLQRWSSLWPTQLYTTLSAIVLLWLGIEKWWKDTD
jgi:hypothetical protein